MAVDVNVLMLAEVDELRTAWDVRGLLAADLEVDELRTAWDIMVLLAAGVEVDELRTAWDVRVLVAADVVHEKRDMSAATTSQKKPALSSMTAACMKKNSDDPDTDGTAVGTL